MRNHHPVTSQIVLIGWRAGLQLGSSMRALDVPVLRRLALGVRVTGCLAAILLVIVGCASITGGTPTANNAIAGLPGVGVCVDLGVVGDVEYPGVATTGIADGASRGPRV
jgi:hypothetical protein